MDNLLDCLSGPVVDVSESTTIIVLTCFEIRCIDQQLRMSKVLKLVGSEH